ADRNRSHWSTSKTPSYTKSVSWQHHRELCRIPEDPHHWNGFSGEKRILYGHSAHHFFFSSSTIHVSLPRLITDYEVQKISFFSVTCH
ncbi:hypothetical protein OSL42_03675, partial [Escherichia coli]|nr:hypothetical protein [Escherichia coli]MDA6885964.1 hypothetical protein [Escherichia coli]